jgi:hypothetical protein
MAWLRGDTVAPNLFDLPPPERLKRFRELSAEAQAVAHNTIKPELRDDYLNIARRWDELADQLEESMRHEQDSQPK